MESVALSFRTEAKKRAMLDKVASHLDRNRNWVINDAIDNYLELYRIQGEEIEHGIAELDAGKGLSIDEVRAALRLSK